jgi:hypothetical protein
MTSLLLRVSRRLLLNIMTAEVVHGGSSESLSLADLQSPKPKSNLHSSSRLSVSFTSPPSDCSCNSFPGVSPRQASISVSFSSNNTCPLDYSTDEVDSLALLPISPVSQCDDDENKDESNNERYDDPCSLSGELEGHSNSHCKDKRTTPDKDENDNGIITNKVHSAPSQDNLSSSVPTEISAPSRNYSDCNRRNKHGQSALSISSSNCFLRGMMLLIDRGADVNLIDSYGRSPLHLACENTESSEHHECILALLEHGADMSIQGEYHLYSVGFVLKI